MAAKKSKPAAAEAGFSGAGLTHRGGVGKKDGVNEPRSNDGAIIADGSIYLVTGGIFLQKRLNV